MGKYIGPRLKIIRRLGILPGLTLKKLAFQSKTPGEHGKVIFKKFKRLSLADDFRIRLFEKQKLRFNYCISEKQLLNYYYKVKAKKGSTGILLLQLLELRLDCVVYRLGFAPTIFAARQIINHGHILVNDQIVNIPSFICNINDTIKAREKVNSKNLLTNNFKKYLERKELSLIKLKLNNIKELNFPIFLPSHLIFNLENLTGKVISQVKRHEVLAKINELKVIEYYSR
jgi:small subunit ribosomal protein S4